MRTNDFGNRPSKSLAGTLVGFGKHKGQTVEELILEEPGYVLWALDTRNPIGALVELCRDIGRAIQAFDDRPFLKPCQTVGCTRPATHCEIYVTSPTMEPGLWCAACKPRPMRYSGVEVILAKSYCDVVNYMRMFHRWQMDDLKRVLSVFAKTKGIDQPFQPKPGRIY